MVRQMHLELENSCLNVKPSLRSFLEGLCGNGFVN